MAEKTLEQLLSDDDQPEEMEAEQEEAEVEQPEPEQAEEPEPETPEEPETEQQPQQVPLAALKEARGQNKALKDRLEQIERMLASQTQQQDRPKPPDVMDDPEGYSRFMEAQMAAVHSNAVATISERFARQTHGELVDEAFEAAKSQGMLDKFRGGQDPWGDLVKWHQSQRVMSEIGGDPDGWRKRELEKMRKELQAEMAAASIKPGRGSGPSLASQPNLGSRDRQEWSGPTPLDDILGNPGG